MAAELNIEAIELAIGETQLSWLGHIHGMKQKRRAREVFEARVQGTNKIERLRL